MDVRQLLFTNNDCYKANRAMKPTGIMWHSTGANNPTLKRYVGPDDGALGRNLYNNHWNRPKPDGRQVCVHAFIGKLNNGKIATYQTLPWTIEGWHSGAGPKGSANRLGYIGFEICEDGLNNADYFNAVYTEAVELTTYLCRLYNIAPEKVICHSEGYKMGIASNHADVMHWFPKFGKSMDTARQDVARMLHGAAARSYLVKVTAGVLNIRSNPGTHNAIVGQIKDQGVYTIVEEYGGWGKLKSGVGWISLAYTKTV